MHIVTNPAEIERRSLEIIGETLRTEYADMQFEPRNMNVLKRVIHATADFDYARNLFFSTGAVPTALQALKNGARIVTDTQMAKAGINKKTVAELGCELHCFIDAPEVVETARINGYTRARAAVDRAAGMFDDAVIFVVGNAPTALIRLHELITENAYKPVFIIGVPVGFVNVTESKELILGLGVPHIVAKGRKGGSSVAAAICNALLYEAAERVWA